MKRLILNDLRALMKIWLIATAVFAVIEAAGEYLIYEEATNLAQVIENQGGYAKFLSSQHIMNVIIAVTVAAGIAYFLFILATVAYRFNQSFFTDKGYLTLSLPVKREELILSKYISAATVVGLSTFVVVNSVILLFASKGWFPYSENPVTVFCESFISNFKKYGIILNTVGRLDGFILMFTFAMCLSAFIFLCLTVAQKINKSPGITAAVGFAALVITVAPLFNRPLHAAGHRFIRTGDPYQQMIFVLVLGTAIMFFIGLTAIMYLLETDMLKKKINLR